MNLQRLSLDYKTHDPTYVTFFIYIHFSVPLKRLEIVEKESISRVAKDNNKG